MARSMIVQKLEICPPSNSATQRRIEDKKRDLCRAAVLHKPKERLKGMEVSLGSDTIEQMS